MTNSFDELARAGCLFVIGSNTTVAHPMVGMRLMRCQREGGRLIVADPRRTDLALIAERTENFDELRESLRAWTPEKTEEVTGVPRELLFRAAELYARSETSAIVYCLGITQPRCGVNNVRSLANLSMLCGQIGRPCTGVNPLRGQNNVQGACDMGGLPNYYPGYQFVDDEAVRLKFEAAWGRPLSPARGLTAMEMMHGLQEGRLKAMIIMGENPVVSDPDSGHVVKALSSAEFLLCIDIFPTPTTELAHMVLPGASFPPMAGRTNGQIIQALSRRLGYDMHHASASEVFDEICSLAPSMGGMSYARLEGEGLCWPCPTPGHPGTPILHLGRFTRGKGLFAAIPHVPPAELPDEEYPLLLSTGMRHAHYLTGTMTRRCAMLERELPELVTDINPADARRLEIREGARLRMVSRRGAVVSRMHITDDVPEGLVFAPLHFAEAMVNLLTCTALDPVSKTPEYKISAVRLERV